MPRTYGRTRNRTLAGLAALAAAIVPASAQAGGFAFPTFGGELGHPTTANATAVYFNPGAITQSEGTRIFLDGTLVLRKQEWKHDPAPMDDTSVPGANSGKAELFNALAAPFLGLTTSIDDLALGAGLYAPFGGAAAWDSNSRFKGDSTVPGAVDGVQRWHNISGSLTSLYITGAAAYEFADMLSLGISVNGIFTEALETRARTPSGDNDLSLEGRSSLKMSGWQWSLGFGVLAEPIEDTLWLGASYQMAPNGDGRMTLDGNIINAFPPQGPADPAKVSLHQRYPDIVRLGGRVRPTDTLELRLFGDYQRWSLFEDQCVALKGEPCKLEEDGSNAVPSATVLQNARRNWHDTVGVRAGASWFTNEDHDVELYAGAGYDGNAAPATTLDPGVPDARKVILAGGGRFRLASALHLAATYTHVHQIERDNTGQSILPTLSDPTRTPDGGGVYRGWIGFFNVNVEIGF